MPIFPQSPDWNALLGEIDEAPVPGLFNIRARDGHDPAGADCERFEAEQLLSYYLSSRYGAGRPCPRWQGRLPGFRVPSGRSALTTAPTKRADPRTVSQREACHGSVSVRVDPFWSVVILIGMAIAGWTTGGIWW
jgi:hypothetical protein